MQPKHLQHRHGGTITALYAVGHETFKGVADWFYIGDVRWTDGTTSVRTRIAPFALCINGEDGDDARDEINAASDALNAYLCYVGDWHDAKHKRDGRVYHWTPHKPTGEQRL